uniref:Uncharacterized protein n=1 Tax=Ditylenchus dipsaci TaxID=166011 RepID=A0A915E672_9BILA
MSATVRHSFLGMPGNKLGGCYSLLADEKTVQALGVSTSQVFLLKLHIVNMTTQQEIQQEVEATKILQEGIPVQRVKRAKIAEPSSIVVDEHKILTYKGRRAGLCAALLGSIKKGIDSKINNR